MAEVGTEDEGALSDGARREVDRMFRTLAGTLNALARTRALAVCVTHLETARLWFGESQK